MAIINIDRVDIDILTSLDNFIEYNYVESACQHGFTFMKDDRKLYLYIGQNTGVHSAHIYIGDKIVGTLCYQNKDYIMVYDQSIYFEHEAEGDRKKTIEVDTENIAINVNLLDRMSPIRKDWLEASSEKLENRGFRLLKNGISCTSEADRGRDIFYRCLFCETMISSTPKDSVSCKCGRITIDVGMHRLFVKNLTKIQVLEKYRK